jgi:hypothetical protein
VPDHQFTIDVGNAHIAMECIGRNYDINVQIYRPQYQYTITLLSEQRWQYVGNDIFGAVNESPDNKKAMQSLLAFLYAAQEAKDDSENSTLFPPHVREWAAENSEEISQVAVELGMANALVTTPAVGVPLYDATDDPDLHHCPQCGDPCGVTDYSDGRCKTCVRADDDDEDEEVYDL